MATININFDVKSIRNAIKQVKEVKKKLSGEVIKIFLNKCLDWVQDRANIYLTSFFMSDDIINDIQAKWDRDIKGNIATLINESDKATFIEFGVGIIGQNNPHPNAYNNSPPYEYNVNSGRKDANGKWRFKLDEEKGVDLNVGYYTTRTSGDGKLISTQGSPANLYLYNSAMDLISTGAYKTLWQESLKQAI